MSFSFGPPAPCGCRPLRRRVCAANSLACRAQSRQCCDVRFALCVVFAEFAFGKLVSLPGLGPGNAAFPHTRPLPPFGGGSYTMRVCAANSLACQGLALAMLRFPLTLLFPSERLSLSDAEFAKGKLVWLAGRSPGNASFPHTRPLPPFGGDSCTPTSGTNIRTTRKPRPL